MNYLETIKIADGHPCNLEYHFKRMEHTIGCRLPLYPESCHPFDLQLSPEFCSGLIKCRIVYNSSAILSISYLPYHLPIIKSLKPVECNNLDYKFKYEDRSLINALRSANCSTAEDILIIQNGFVTDTSFCNVVFENNLGLFTPSTPLLKGTKRQYLLNTGQIQECPITYDSLNKYNRILLINAMIDLSDISISPPKK